MATTNLLIILFVLVSICSTFNAGPSYLRFECNEIGNYTTNSTYQNNLKILLNSLSSNASSTGYFADIAGTIPDRVHGLALCRGDVSVSECEMCLADALQDVQDVCSFQKTATIWYYNCLLRYSKIRLGYSFTTFTFWNPVNVTSEWERFNQSLMTLMNGLTRYAAYNISAPPPSLFATGRIDFNAEFPTIYGLVQCTRDLSRDECNMMLTTHITEDLWPPCCIRRHSVGSKMLGKNCILMYQVFKFYHGPPRLSLPAITASSPTMSPRPPPTQRPPTADPPERISQHANTTDDQGDKKNSTTIILAIVIPLAASLVLFLIGCIFFLKRKRALKTRRTKELAPTDSLLFDLSTIKIATDNFSESNKLGEGGFGEVYKGKLQDGQEIAAKRLSARSTQGLTEFRNEVILLVKLQHRNLVRLLGVCLEEEEKILVYEFIQNKSLDTVLFDPTQKYQLNWERRYNIIKGITRGMLYLHEESQLKIVHRDLKLSNILVDADMNPKISDFGLARLFEPEVTHACTSRVVGTIGYLAPEYAMRGLFSEKSDVFSFGVLVLEILTGRKVTDSINSENLTDLLSYVWKNWRNGTTLDILDPSFSGQYSQDETKRCFEIGLLCVQEDPTNRPTMLLVNHMLNSYSIMFRPPSTPAFVIGITDTSSTHLTSNEVSIANSEPR